jgi:hypothetical protein
MADADRFIQACLSDKTAKVLGEQLDVVLGRLVGITVTARIRRNDVKAASQALGQRGPDVGDEPCRM